MATLTKRVLLETLFNMELYHTSDYEGLGHELKYDEDYFFSIEVGDEENLRYFKVEARGEEDAWDKACQEVTKAMIFAGSGNWLTHRIY